MQRSVDRRQLLAGSIRAGALLPLARHATSSGIADGVRLAVPGSGARGSRLARQFAGAGARVEYAPGWEPVV